MKRSVILFLVLLLINSYVFANEKDNAIKKGIEFHNSVSELGEEAVNNSLILLKPYIENDPIACAYYGSSLTIKANFCSEKDPLLALKYLEEGSSYIDAAINMDKNNIQVRCVRLVNGINISKASPYKRYSIIEKDMEYLLQDSVLNVCDKTLQSMIYLYSGILKIEQNLIEDALDLFDLAIEVDPEGLNAKEAKLMLIKYGE